MKKTAVVAVLAGAALAVGGAVASTASAQDVPTGGIGNNVCAAPWQWNGPGTLALSGQTTSYETCGGEGASTAEGFTFGNNACLLPWQWNGPFNAMLTGNTTSYSACNS